MSLRPGLYTLGLLAMALPTAPAFAQQAESLPPPPRQSSYAQLQNLRMYYQLYGQGHPLLLLHAGGSTIERSFARQLADFSRDHLVIAPEQMGHGRTPDANRPLSYGEMAENTAELLGQLHVTTADVVGWSDGAIVGLLLAVRHPELVRRLVISGANVRPGTETITPAKLAELTTHKLEEDSAGRARYARVSADSTGHYPIFIVKLKALWLNHPTERELSQADLAQIRAPTLVVAGDRDVIRLEHTIDIFHSIPGAELLIVPGTGHPTFRDHPEWLNPIIRSFLEQELPPR